jgi:hypothetical protein
LELPVEEKTGILTGNPMIECVPRGICSWSFILTGDGHQGSTEINAFGEQGALTADGRYYKVAKGGWLSGEWMLVDGSSVIARAQKRNAFLRTFDLAGPGGAAVLSARSLMGRAMRFEGNGADFVIEPAHAFTRRATIGGSTGDFPTTVFAFWLTTLLWRRAAQSNNGAGGAG